MGLFVSACDTECYENTRASQWRVSAGQQQQQFDKWWGCPYRRIPCVSLPRAELVLEMNGTAVSRSQLGVRRRRDVVR